MEDSRVREDDRYAAVRQYSLAQILGVWSAAPSRWASWPGSSLRGSRTNLAATRATRSGTGTAQAMAPLSCWRLGRAEYYVRGTDVTRSRAASRIPLSTDPDE
jgi:hypothetical protein